MKGFFRLCGLCEVISGVWMCVEVYLVCGCVEVFIEFGKIRWKGFRVVFTLDDSSSKNFPLPTEDIGS